MAELRCQQKSVAPALTHPVLCPTYFLGIQSQALTVSCPLLSPLDWVLGLSLGVSLFFNPLHTLLSLSGFVLVSWGCCNKLPQTQCLKTTEIYSLPVLEVRRLKSVSLSWNWGISWAMLPPQALGENLLLASSSFWRLWAFLGLWLHHSGLCLCLHSAFSSSLCAISLCLPLIRTLVIRFRAHLDNLK